MSTRSFVTVFLLAPVMRHVARIELPSTSAPTIAARFSVDNLFILTIMLERLRIVKQGSLHSKGTKGRQPGSLRPALGSAVVTVGGGQDLTQGPPPAVTS